MQTGITANRDNNIKTLYFAASFYQESNEKKGTPRAQRNIFVLLSTISPDKGPCQHSVNNTSAIAGKETGLVRSGTARD